MYLVLWSNSKSGALTRTINQTVWHEVTETQGLGLGAVTAKGWRVAEEIFWSHWWARLTGTLKTHIEMLDKILH